MYFCDLTILLCYFPYFFSLPIFLRLFILSEGMVYIFVGHFKSFLNYMCLTRWVNRMVAVEIESKRKFAKKENGGFTGRLIIMDEGKVLRDL